MAIMEKPFAAAAALPLVTTQLDISIWILTLNMFWGVFSNLDLLGNR